MDEKAQQALLAQLKALAEAIAALAGEVKLLRTNVTELANRLPKP